MRLRRALSTTAIAAFGLLATVGPGSAQAASDERASVFNFRGNYASAYSFSSDGCTDSAVFVDGFQSAARSNSNDVVAVPQQGTGLSVAAFSYNWCTGEFMRDAAGYIENAGQTRLGGMRSARLKGSVQAYDWFTGETKGTLDVDLTLTGSGRLETNHYTYRGDFWGVRFHDHGTGRYRAATATGTVRLDGRTIARGADLQASLGSGTSGSVMIGDFELPEEPAPAPEG